MAAKELPAGLTDGIERLAAVPGEDDVVLTPDGDTTTYTGHDSDAAAEPSSQPKAPAPTKPGAKATAGAQQQAKPQPPTAVNLDDLPQFREYKASRDRAHEEQRRMADEAIRRADEAERKLAAYQQAQSMARVEALSASLNEVDDPAQRQQIIDEIAATRANTYYSQIQAWEQRKAKEITEAGLDPNDPRFRRNYTAGDAGVAEFHRDLNEAKLERTSKEFDAYKKQFSADSLAEMVRQQVAAALQGQGLNTTDTGTQAESTPTDAEEAMDDLQQGRISWAEYKRRTG